MPKGKSAPENTSTRPQASPSGGTTLRRRYKTEEPLTLDEVLVRGEEAARLLESPVYQLAHNMAIESVVEEWISTEEGETQKRESMWREIRALALTQDMLVALINQAQQQNLTQEQAAEQDLNRYEDEQGFGLNYPEDPPLQ
jgi:endo-alpha-1,4-polygalactosaminidase (GH114 family)